MFQEIQQVEDFLANRINLGIKPGLERMEKLLTLLNQPQHNFNAIHIAGTNGKGSTLEFIKQGLQANNYQVGIFTSPSLTGLRGYILLGDRTISEHDFLTIWQKVYPAVVKLDNMNMHPTEFEILTAIAFVYFEQHTDLALIETGMGGREDTTNCVQPLMSIITNIAKDHTAFLGDTIREIAYHKAGIIKSTIPVITGELIEDATKVVNKEAMLKQAPIYRLGHHFFYRSESTAYNHRINWWEKGGDTFQFWINMMGEHQKANASIATMALQLLNRMEAGFNIDMKKVEEAFTHVMVMGRFEIVRKQPLIIVDGAHNSAGMEAFINTVEENFSNCKRHLLFSAFKDKEIDKMLKQIENHFTTISLTTFDHPRAMQVSELRNYESDFHIELNWQEAIRQMEQSHTVYFISGSLYFISLVRSFLKKQ